MSLWIVLSTPPEWHWDSWGIKKFTNSDVSHSSFHTIGQGHLRNKPLVFEATGDRGVSVVHGDRWALTSEILYRIKCVDESVEDSILQYR